MKWKKKEVDYSKWRRCFAFLPREITDKNCYVWLQWIEKRQVITSLNMLPPLGHIEYREIYRGY